MKIKHFFLGAAATLLLLMLTGAIDNGSSSSATLNFGRYQLSSFATSFGDKGGVIGAFVIDTVSGETRTVYSRIYGPEMESKLVKNDLKKPFISIQ